MTTEGMICYSIDVERSLFGYEVVCRKDGKAMARAGPFLDFKVAERYCQEWREHAWRLRKKYMQ